MAVYDFRNFSSSKFVDDFGREFKKHEVLWQSYFLMDPNQIQFAKNKAYKCIAYKLDLTVDRVIELLKDFPNVCFDMLKQTFTKKYNTSGSSVSDGPRQQLPKWLLYLMMKSDMFEKLKQNEQLNTVTTSNEPDVLIQELLTSVELSLEGSYGKKIQRLKGPCAVKYFAKKYGVRVADVLSVWQGIYNLCLLKLKALLNLSSRLHDVPGTLRLNHQEWKVTDLILLYKHDLKLINLSNFSTGRKHSSLILLYKLMVAARSYYQQEIHVDNRDDARDENNERDECDDEADKDTAAVLKDLNRNNAGKSSQEAMDEGENNEITQRTEQANAAVAENEKDELESNSCKDVPALVLKVEGIDENNWYGRAVEQKVVWALVYTGFINRGRSASIIYLQRRWLELVHLARNTILNVWNSEDKDVKVHPLLPLLVNRFPEIITDYLPPWRQIVRERLYVMESDIEDLLIECLQNEKLNLDINEDLSDSDFIKEFYENELSCLNTNDKMYNENLEVTDILEKIDPSKAKVTIKFEDSDDGDMCGDSVYGEVNFDCSGEDSQYVNQYDDMSLDLIDNIDRDIKEEYDLMDNTDSMGTSVTGDAVRAYNENNSTDDVFIKSEDQIKSEAEDNIWQETEISPEEVKREGSPDIDEKLIKESHVVLTPVDNFNEWKKYSRDGTISCRRFSIKNFSKLIVIDSKQLRKCRRYVNKDNTKEIDKYFNCRIKYENVDNAEDVRSETIAGEKVKELNAMPYIARKNRIELTKKLKLSRTYYTSGFWCNERNIERLRQCRPMHVKLYPSRIPKKVELSDINEVRKINSMLQTARVSPTPAAVDNHQTCDVTMTEVNSTSHHVYEHANVHGDGQTTTNSPTSIVDRSLSELQKLLKELPEPSTRTAESKITTKPRSDTIGSSFMDSVIESIRSENNGMFSMPSQHPAADTPTSNPTDSSNSNDDATKSNKTPVNTKSVIQCLEETLRDEANAKLRDSILALAKKKMVPKADDVKVLVKDLAAKCETLKYKDDGDLLPKLWKIHEYRVARRKKELTRNIIVLTKYLPQFKAFLKKRRKRIRNRKIIKKTDKLTDKSHNNTDKSHNNTDKSHNNTDKSHNNEKSEASAVPKDDDDDDSEPNLVIDESVKETKDDEKEECRKDNNKNVRDNTKTRADGKHKNNRKKKRIEKPNDEEKPLHDEYQEWQRQKTMNLKYFTLPNNSQTTDKPSKDSGDKDKKKSKTAGSLKNKTIGTNTDNVAQTESVVLISDSDSDVQIVDSDGTNPPTNKQGINQPINLDLDRISKDSKQFVYPAMNLHPPPIYIVYNNLIANNGTPTPASYSQVVVQVHPLAIPPPAQDLMKKPANIPVASVEDLTKDKPRRESGVSETALNTEPSDAPSPHVDKLSWISPPSSTINLKEYTANYNILSAPLIKVDQMKKLLCLLNKYILLTDVNLPCDQPTFRTIGSKNTKCLTEVLMGSSGDVLLLGKKGSKDYRVCKCEDSSENKCDLCIVAHAADGTRLNLIKIRRNTFKRIADYPLKYVRLSAEEVRRTTRAILELIPDIIFMNLMFYKRLASSPLLYSRLLSAIPDEECFRQLISKDVELYWLDMSQPLTQYRPLYYSKTNGTFSTTHPDPELDKVLSWIVNKKS